MSTSPISTSQPTQNIESEAIVEAPDTATIQKVDDLSLSLFQKLMALQILNGICSFADEYTVVQIADGKFIMIGEESGMPFYCAILIDVEPNEETEVSESADSTLSIEEISDEEISDSEEAFIAPEVQAAVGEPLLAAS